MIRTMLQLPEQTHKALRHLAVEQKKSLAELIRNAIDATYSQDLKDIARAQKLMAKFRPGSGMALEEYHRKRQKRS